MTVACATVDKAINTVKDELATASEEQIQGALDELGAELESALGEAGAELESVAEEVSEAAAN